MPWMRQCASLLLYPSVSSFALAQEYDDGTHGAEIEDGGDSSYDSKGDYVDIKKSILNKQNER